MYDVSKTLRVYDTELSNVGPICKIMIPSKLTLKIEQIDLQRGFYNLEFQCKHYNITTKHEQQEVLTFKCVTQIL